MASWKPAVLALAGGGDEEAAEDDGPGTNGRRFRSLVRRHI